MIVGILYALLASTINLTVLGNLLGTGLPVQLAVVGAGVGWLYHQSRFSWTVMLVSGLIYDALATTRFGLFIILFALAGLLIEQAVLHKAQYGTNPTLFVSTALAGCVIYTATLIGSGVSTVQLIFSLIGAALLTGGSTLFMCWIFNRFTRV